uniref:Uncharacterized protein AlNc14C2G245 n=1 Tax=Albugo laibachii Nc14 TaxID=890382 RepID=F0VZA4_9STRA|nr:conserved hypothetical protein [Albugo laibachii Nc14]|eukprot:CCA14134.1 conserved hypothetical protein [Albugo laibachii Nc14]
MASAHRRSRDAANLNKNGAFAGSESPNYHRNTEHFLSTSRHMSRSGTFRFLFLALLLICVFVTYIHFVQFTRPSWLSRTLNEAFYNKSMVEFTTKKGSFTIELFPQHAPKSVQNFQKIVESGFYASSAGFYRNEPNFVLQGGSFLSETPSPVENVPVEYSLPSTQRMVVVARQKNANSGNTEFAIMLHDNTVSNMPSGDSPGFAVFGRIIDGWHTIEQISKAMPSGYLSVNEKKQQISFEQVASVERLTNDDPEAKLRLEELRYIIATPHTAVIFAQVDCVEAKEITNMLREMHVTYRIEEIGHSSDHPFELDALAALSGHVSLPLLYANKQWIRGLQEAKEKYRDGSLEKLLDASGALAEEFASTVIRNHPLVIFSKSYCPYCKKAKRLLADLGATPFLVELDLRPDGKAIQEFLMHLTHQNTVPNVFVQQKSIGGADKTQKMFDSGELKHRLQEAKAIS